MKTLLKAKNEFDVGRIYTREEHEQELASALRYIRTSVFGDNDELEKISAIHRASILLDHFYSNFGGNVRIKRDGHFDFTKASQAYDALSKTAQMRAARAAAQ